MAPDIWRPDVVIGIDFGMTCTGVAWSAAPEWTDPKTINNWPGKASYETRNKVDTAVSYSVGTQVLQSWGFECDEDDETIELNKLFKLFLDPQYVDGSGCAPPHDEVQHWYRDYLTYLYHCVMRYFQDRIPRFASKNVEFVFSVPTTWKEPGMIADIERMIRAAGYGRQATQRVVISLTEAEAAAVYASKQQMQKGDVFLVCDAGGGTTDLNVLKVTSAARGKTELEPLDCNEGASIGSTLIDHKMEAIILKRLKLIRADIRGDLDSIARKMIQDRFMTYKCSFGSGAMNVPKLPLPIPGLAPGQDFPHAGIENSNIVLMSAELQSIFDEQIDKICDLIDQQLSAVQHSHAGETVSYLVLSGGLGSSPYVQKKDISVLLATEPQLAVVHGLILARTQALKGGPEVLSSRRCPVSYGVLCREAYDQTKHQGEDVEQDPFDKKRYAEKQVSWFIKQGQVVDMKDGINQRFRYKIPLGHERDPWRTKIVMSTLSPGQLPKSTKHDGVKQVCTVETVLDTGDMRRKNHKWYHFRKEYNLAEFDVKLRVGTGLQFEIWGQQGCRSKGHEEIEVEWESPDGAPTLAKAAYDVPAMYRA
ncbi:hypothetical protein LTR85_011906 [Meristemomyces frigidus]|nr:hypothetical protein LTR85_011906 [Meristemomyces frigidus]